jgi:hypothetical protein
MRMNRQMFLFLTLATLLSLVVWDYFFVTANTVQPVQPTVRSNKSIFEVKNEPVEMERRPKFAESGDDLFYTQAEQVKQVLPTATSTPKQNAAQMRKVRTLQTEVVQTPPAPTVVAASTPSSSPNFPYLTFGQYSTEDKRYLLLAKNSQTVAVQAGDILDGSWKLLSINQSIASFQHIPSGQTLQLVIAKLP